jgi:D-glycero-D-manno-heptose 1,7-bisphosphate phosphatase
LSRGCVFLDRDGVINQKAPPHAYIRDWSQFRFLPNIAGWIRIFNALDYLVIVVTNQRGIARGFMSRKAVDAIHANMIGELARAGARIDDVFVCPHENDACDCRKPKPGLVQQAKAKWDIDLERSLLIGDSDDDEGLAQACGLRFLRADGSGNLVEGSL